MHLSSLMFFLLMSSHLTDSKENSVEPLANNIFIDSLLVIKTQRILIAFSKNEKIKTYHIALGKNPVGKKQFKDDFKTPEGLYFIDAKSSASKFHKNLNISYPNQSDIAFGKQCGRKCGGDIKIHGLPNGFDEKVYHRTDWTWGCIAVTNTEIDELYAHTKLGSPILILP